jgi:hypothetical protein
MFTKSTNNIIIIPIVISLFLFRPFAQAVYALYDDTQKDLSSNKPEYVPGELILKLRKDAVSRLDVERTGSSNPAAASTGIISLDEIAIKHNLVIERMTPVFKAIKEKEVKEGLSFQEQIGKIRAKFPERSKRASKTASPRSRTTHWSICAFSARVIVVSSRSAS